MRIDSEGPVGPSTAPSPSTTDAAAAQAAALAARAAAQSLHNPEHRAAAGWGLANKQVSAGTSLADNAINDASANARTAINRVDAPEVRNVVEHLGNALVDGRIDPHVNDSFRQALYDVATEPPDSGKFRGSLAQLTRAAEVLDKTSLAAGTKLTYDPGAGQNGVARAGLPVLSVPSIDADVYYKSSDGTLHLDSAKASPEALSGTVQKSIDGAKANPPSVEQLDRQAEWNKSGTPAAPRELTFYSLDDGPGFNHLLDNKRVAQLDTLVGGDADARRFLVGDRAYSINDFKQISANAAGPARAHVEALKAAHVASGQPVETFNTAEQYDKYYSSKASTASEAVRNFGGNVGEPRSLLTKLPPPELPSLRAGGAFGAAAAGAVTLLRVGSDGDLSAADMRDVAGHTALGGAIGITAAAGERVVTPIVDRALGAAVQRGATSAVSAVAPAVAPESAAVFGAGARTLATRIGGSTVVGAAIATGISAYENREGLARGDSQAIGNVTADTVVGAGSVLAATATGALIGSAIPVPVVGTVVGAVGGLAVGIYVANQAQITGARDAIANTVSGWVDGIKGWF